MVFARGAIFFNFESTLNVLSLVPVNAAIIALFRANFSQLFVMLFDALVKRFRPILAFGSAPFFNSESTLKRF